jgi:hypothetical protein
MASNSFWRIYLVKEDKQWRVGKLEIEYTH